MAKRLNSRHSCKKTTLQCQNDKHHFEYLKLKMKPKILQIESSRTIPGTSRDNTTSPHRRPNLNPYLITEKMLQEKLKRENTGRYITQLCIGISASLGALSFGIDLGWSSPATAFLINATDKPQSSRGINTTEEEYTWIGSLMPLGCSLGIVPWHYSVTKIGPKHTIIMQTPFYVLTFLVMITVKTMDAFLAGRFFSGFLSIANLVGGECLLMDCVHRGNLGHMWVLFRSSIYLGVILAYVVGHFLTRNLIMVTCAAIPVVNMMLLAFLPESPVFLYGRSEMKAEKALTWYRGRANIFTEMRYLKKDAELRKMDTESSNYMLYSKVVIRALSIICGLIFFQVFSGYHAFIFYALLLWQEAEIRMDPFVEIIIFGMFLYFGNFFANMIHYHIDFGVRKPLLLSTILTATVLTILSLYSFSVEKRLISPQSYDWIPFIMLNTFVITYEAGLGVYAHILLLNYLPYQVHISAKMIVHVWFWLQVFFITKYFITIKSLTTTAITFGILALISYLSIIYCYLFIIETKGKNLLQIQLEIGGNPIGNRSAFSRHKSFGTSTTPIKV
ncbi:hypothetical protein ILUMI_10486 [Ignelater luminosus]|uniref:Uncharacterized protein n=1 Tax=Ignelater luminosus TaxID=2038154 RepID=A0A8K0D225_IGNLU|nr:hypothetical protein ILUMI_10486 [Ignelater luminosus]